MGEPLTSSRELTHSSPSEGRRMKKKTGLLSRPVWWSLPLSTPGKKEIILNKNKGSFFNFLARYRAYTSGEIFSLSWDGRIMKENWRTPTISDYIANYGVADFKNNGQKQLVVGIVQSTGVTFISDGRSVLYCYDLGEVKPSPK